MCTTIYVTENKETSHYTTNCLHFHESYISKFDFMNYLFANLVVAWLYWVGVLVKKITYCFLNSQS